MAQYSEQLFLAPHASGVYNVALAHHNNQALASHRPPLYSLGSYSASNAQLAPTNINNYQNLLQYQQNATAATHYQNNTTALIPYANAQQMAGIRTFEELQNSEEFDRRSRKMINTIPSHPILPFPSMQDDRKYSYKLADMKEIFMWYTARQQAVSRAFGHRAIVENLIIYLEGLKVTYRDKDISIKECVNWAGVLDTDGGPRPDEAFRDSLNIKMEADTKITCPFIIDTVVNFLHTGTLGSLCMMETISSYFIPVHNGSGLSKSEIYQDASQLTDKGVGYKKVVGGYAPGECGTLTIHQDGSYSLKAYGIILVVGIDFVAMTCKPVTIERLTTSSIRLLHPRGQYNLPKHVLRYPNRPVASDLTLPSTPMKGTETPHGTMVFMRRDHLI
ncbi:uncharacterized protein LOC108667895 [Hyalella azteca]|uniref:Uncharacterized protein LOC108667895 n=1 Tax=Hyalella azteca TaxID=294128 RepID=A0A8B7NA77_HYAAZ|nr:uncharacterized protein LOC108667895 [Hyalella azteca]XP_047739832.1 uncharacterized protein LOC108667895 [Hyalella azteca]XP_047739833.1 uncharacterized protein LOC108667895 [Hyalella azteca]